MVFLTSEYHAINNTIGLPNLPITINDKLAGG